jgi:large subunit ribosomal protein L25
LIEVKLDGKSHPVIVREKQMDYIRSEIIHVDFQEVSLTEKLRTSVTIQLDGDAPAIKEHDAVLTTALTEIEVEALPQDLPEKFLVDVSVLKEIGDSIFVKDIPTPENVTILTDPEEMVVVASYSSTGLEEEAEEEAVTTDEPEVIEKGKSEDEEDF